MAGTLKTDIIPYLEPDGLVTPKLEPPGFYATVGNSVYRDVYYVLLSKRGELENTDIDAWKTSISLCQVNGHPGLFNRSSFKKEELQAHDDYVGIALASKYLDGGETARRILEAGVFGSWNNLAPGIFTLRTFFARHPQFMAHLYMCAGKPVPLFWKTLYSAWMFFGTPKDHTGWMLGYMYADSGPRWVREAFMTKLYAKHPGGMKDVYSQMFNPTHPLALYQLDERA